MLSPGPTHVRAGLSSHDLISLQGWQRKYNSTVCSLETHRLLVEWKGHPGLFLGTLSGAGPSVGCPAS